MISPEVKIIHKQTYDFIYQLGFDLLKWSNLKDAIKSRQIAFEEERLACVSVLPTLTCYVVGGDTQVAIPLAAAWVLYDLASDIFDDLQDQDGKDWPWNKWEFPISLNVGISLIAMGQMCLEQMAISTDIKSEINFLWNKATAFAAHGQAKSRKTPNIDDYYRQVIAKSGLIFATVSWSGARLASDNQIILEQVYDFGMSLGMLIQIKDDVRDLYDSNHVEGEEVPIISDLRNGVYSLPILFALTKTKSPKWSKLIDLLANKDSLETKAICQILEEMGAIDHALAMAYTYKQKALEILHSFPRENSKHLIHYVDNFLPS